MENTELKHENLTLAVQALDFHASALMEQQAPLIQFKYSNGKTGVIMACRHFLYYGNIGNSFEPFRQKVLEVLKSDHFVN